MIKSLQRFVSIFLCTLLIFIVIPDYMDINVESEWIFTDKLDTHLISGQLVNHPLILSFQFQHINQRWFLWQYPTQSPSPSGYPVLFILHGAAQYPFSWFIGLHPWGREQLSFAYTALDHGYLIIAPASSRPISPGPRAWNVFEDNINQSEDVEFIIDIIEWFVNEGISINLDKVYCAGFSSGAFMTSRLAHDVPEIFSAVAVHSGANADSIELTNRGPIFDCTSPQIISPHHPPTIIIHGQEDSLVPYDCGIRFYYDLQHHNISSSILLDEEKGHIWISSFNYDILQWFSNVQ